MGKRSATSAPREHVHLREQVPGRTVPHSARAVCSGCLQNTRSRRCAPAAGRPGHAEAARPGANGKDAGNAGIRRASLRARIAANERWASTDDRHAAAAPARAGFDARFAAEVDPVERSTADAPSASAPSGRPTSPASLCCPHKAAARPPAPARPPPIRPSCAAPQPNCNRLPTSWTATRPQGTTGTHDRQDKGGPVAIGTALR